MKLGPQQGRGERATKRRLGAHRQQADGRARDGQSAGTDGGKRSSHSGRLMLRMPQSLHAQLARAAEREQISLNQYITNTLSSAVGRRSDGERVEPGGPKWLPAAILAGIVVTVAAAILAIVVLVLLWANGW